MVIVLLLVVVLAAAGVLMFRSSRRAGRTLGVMAWRTALATAAALLVSIALYQKPRSFYTNFVLFPSLTLYVGGLLGAIVTIVLGIAALIRRDDGRTGLMSIGAASLAVVVATIVIVWRAS